MMKIDVLVFFVSIILPNVRSSDDNLQASLSDDFSCCTWMSGIQGTLKVNCPGVNDEPSISCVRNLLANFSGQASMQPLDVHFSDCDISLFEDNFFEPYDVAGLEFRRCGLRVVPVGVFSSACHKLTVGLSFAENSIDSISSSEFQGCFRVMVLDLTYNSIGNIDADDFQYMTQLQSLYLEGNSIQRIDGFKSLANLRQLFINLNDVQYISLNAFEELEMVQILNLADNSITTLENNVFKSLKSLSTLDLKNNLFDCVCSLKWLQDWINQIGLATDTKCETPVFCDMVSFEFCATTTTPMITTQPTTKLTSTTRATSTSSTVAATTVPTSTTTTVPTTTSPTTTSTTKSTTIIPTTESTTVIPTTKPTTTISTTEPTTTIVTTEPTTTIVTTEPTTTISTTEPTTTTSTTPATTTQSSTELTTSSTPETSTTASTTTTPTTITTTTTSTSVSTATSTMTTSTETSTSTQMTSELTTTSLQSTTTSSNGDNGGSDIVVENFTLSDNLTLTWVSTESKVIILFSPVNEGCSPALIDGIFLKLADGVHAVILENETFYTIRDYDNNFSPYLVCIVSAQLNYTMANFICGSNCLNTTSPPSIINPTTVPSQSVVSVVIAIGLICAVVVVGLIIIMWLCCLLRLSRKKDRTLEIEEPTLAVDMAARQLPAIPNTERISCLNPLYGPDGPDHQMTPSYLYLEASHAEDRSSSGGLSTSDTYEKIRQTPSQKYENISDLISVDSNDSQS